MSVGALSFRMHKRNVHLKARTTWWGMKPPWHALVHFLLVLANLPHPKQAGAGLGSFGGHVAPLACGKVFSSKNTAACKACHVCSKAPAGLNISTPP